MAKNRRFFVSDLTALALVGFVAVAVATACAGASAESRGPDRRPYVVADSPEEAGAYLIRTGSCDDCHTPGWAESFGKIPDDQRLMGNPVGFRGEWGTTYAANLRLSAHERTADQWITMIRGRKDMPPMPWFSLHAMSDRDLLAIRAYLRKLGPKGEPAPRAVGPEEEPATAYITFTPSAPKA